MKDILLSMKEEFGAMFSGRFVEYHKAAWVIVIVVSFFFSLLMNHSIGFESRIAVIDADASKFSTELIQQINTSPYIEVTEVARGAVSPEAFLQHDRNIGVLYLPKGLEKAVKRGDTSFNVGYFADVSNVGQNGQVISTLSQIVPSIKTMLQNEPLTEQGLNIAQRNLFNPSNSSTITFAIVFIYFFSSITLGTTMCMLVGRLKVTGQWNTVLRRGVFAFIARIIPYSLIYVSAVTVTTAVLFTFGQLSFAGNYFWYVPTLFMTAIGIGMLASIICWNTTNPGQGPSRMLYVVPPGFIMSGSLLAASFFNQPVFGVKWMFPLSWQYMFFRDFSLRGATIGEMMATYGTYIVYMTILALIIAFLFAYDIRKANKAAAAAPATPAGAPTHAPARPVNPEPVMARN